MATDLGLKKLLSIYEKEIVELEQRLEIKFRNRTTLLKACIHTSFANENNLNVTNERLEFLGDAVLSLVIAEYLFKSRTDVREGELAKLRSALVSEQTLAECAASLGIEPFLLLGKGASQETLGRRSNLADFIEAIIGAIYIDRGYRRARKFILEKLLKERLKQIDYAAYDPKSTLQEYFLAKEGQLPKYQVVNISGPPHNRTFTVQVTFKNKLLAVGTGSSKKSAEKEAARKALINLGLVSNE